MKERRKSKNILYEEGCEGHRPVELLVGHGHEGELQELLHDGADQRGHVLGGTGAVDAWVSRGREEVRKPGGNKIGTSFRQNNNFLVHFQSSTIRDSSIHSLTHDSVRVVNGHEGLHGLGPVVAVQHLKKQRQGNKSQSKRVTQGFKAL